MLEWKTAVISINAFDILAVEINLQIEYDRHKNGYHVLKPDFESSELRLMIDSVQSADFITENEASANNLGWLHSRIQHNKPDLHLYELKEDSEKAS